VYISKLQQKRSIETCKKQAADRLAEAVAVLTYALSQNLTPGQYDAYIEFTLDRIEASQSNLDSIERAFAANVVEKSPF